jgi:hypothetical protein
MPIHYYRIGVYYFSLESCSKSRAFGTKFESKFQRPAAPEVVETSKQLLLFGFRRFGNVLFDRFVFVANQLK